VTSLHLTNRTEKWGRWLATDVLICLQCTPSPSLKFALARLGKYAFAEMGPLGLTLSEIPTQSFMRK
jgi:hypothetical protein